MPITRTNWIDDSGTGTDGTVINNAVKVELYDQIDAALAAVEGAAADAVKKDGTVAMTGALDLGAIGQIAFPATQNPSANVNTLDDYKEGTFTPIIGGTGGQSGQTYGGQTGSYVKIGKLVLASFDVALTAKGTIGGAAFVGGFPFTVGVNGGAAIAYWAGLAIAHVFVSLQPANGSTHALLYGATGATTVLSGLTTNELSNTSRFIGSVIYLA